ncbi:hypothetical protein [uncultured Tenacibaculum sp.]|uniref:hypothetical protein n=1 Tax=uncultured Tenacibaculum sp. TaxID=174713 RepID=UPI002624E136|nr:hypothetical protein [uncultured Tenacibaculum sp.]
MIKFQKNYFNFSIKIIPIIIITFAFSQCIKDTEEREPLVETIIPNFSGNDAIAIDNNGNIIVSEYGRFLNTGGTGTKLFKITNTGIVTDSITNLSGPLGNGIDSKGNIYINDANNTANGQLLKISPNGNHNILATISGWPSGLTLDKGDNIYTTNFIEPNIHKITPKGNVSIFASDPRLTGCVGIDFDSKGNLIVANFATAEILSITEEGIVSSITTIPNIVISGFGIGYITVLNDTVFATGVAVNKIFSVSLKTGAITELIGTGNAVTKDGNFTEASFNGPNGITVDVKNRILYVSEFGQQGGLRKIYLPNDI